MKILFLAPHPFYQERGTPIAVNLLLKALSAAGHRIDVLTYHEGSEVSHPNVTIHRIPRPPLVWNVPPGPSLKKIVCDAIMVFKALAMARRGRYDLVHAVEESAFMAMAIRLFHRTPFLYDMDSSLGRQIAEKYPALSFFRPVLTWLDSLPIRRAIAVVPMCDALADIARQDGARQVFVLRDVSLLKPAAAEVTAQVRKTLGTGSPCFMYVGNLERYQGIDLLLESFRLFVSRNGPGRLIVAGGSDADVDRYRSRIVSLRLQDRVTFIGAQPLDRMAALFEVADVLVSPRIKGSNTPMKIYSYLGSGKAILATDLPTHTQVLTPEVAVLVPPRPEPFAEAMLRLADDEPLCRQLGENARRLAESAYSRAAFDRTVREIYVWVQSHLPS